MKENIKTVSTGYHREITVHTDLGNIYLRVEDTTGYRTPTHIQTFLQKEHAVELATALLEAAGEKIHDLPELPEVTELGLNLHSNNMAQSAMSDPKMVMKKALGLLAIAKELEKRQAEAVERNRAEAKAEREREEKLNKRRDDLAQGLGQDKRTYAQCSNVLRSAIDRIIELEDKPVKKYEL